MARHPRPGYTGACVPKIQTGPAVAPAGVHHAIGWAPAPARAARATPMIVAPNGSPNGQASLHSPRQPGPLLTASPA